jgi:hypothetical protein
MAARLNRRHQDFVREKIRASQLVNRLEEHVLGKVDMTATQVTAALGLLKKCVPDLSAVEHSGTVDVNPLAELTDDELAHTLAALRAGAAGRGGDSAAASSQEPAGIH